MSRLLLVQLEGVGGLRRVSPAQVAWLEEHDDGTTTVHFAGNGWVRVQHPIHDVIERLGAAEDLL